MSNNPIADVDIVVETLANSPVASTTTDSGGNFAVSVTAGTYKVLLTPPAGSSFGSSTIPMVTVSGDTNVQSVLVSIVPTVSFSGVLRDHGGTAVANQTVTICNGYYCGNYHSTTTGADGSFSITEVSPGGYNLYVSGGGGSLPDSYAVYGGIDLTTSVTQDLTLPPTAELMVTVKDPMSNPVPNATVQIYPSLNFDLYPGGAATASADYGATASTDSGGVVQFLLFDGSSVTAYAYPPGGSGLNSGSNSTTMSAATTLEIDLAALVSFSGVLRDASLAPAANQYVCLYYYACSVTDGTGHFMIGGLPPGVSSPIYIYGGGGSLPDSYSVWGPYITVATDSVKTLTLPPTEELTVTVKDPMSNPVPNASVYVYPSGVSFDLYSGGGATAYTGNTSGTTEHQRRC